MIKIKRTHPQRVLYKRTRKVEKLINQTTNKITKISPNYQTTKKAETTAERFLLKMTIWQKDDIRHIFEAIIRQTQNTHNRRAQSGALVKTLQLYKNKLLTNKE